MHIYIYMYVSLQYVYIYIPGYPPNHPGKTFPPTLFEDTSTTPPKSGAEGLKAPIAFGWTWLAAAGGQGFFITR